MENNSAERIAGEMGIIAETLGTERLGDLSISHVVLSPSGLLCWGPQQLLQQPQPPFITFTADVLRIFFCIDLSDLCWRHCRFLPLRSPTAVTTMDPLTQRVRYWCPSNHEGAAVALPASWPYKPCPVPHNSDHSACACAPDLGSLAAN